MNLGLRHVNWGEAMVNLGMQTNSWAQACKSWFFKFLKKILKKFFWTEFNVEFNFIFNLFTLKTLLAN